MASECYVVGGIPVSGTIPSLRSPLWGRKAWSKERRRTVARDTTLKGNQIEMALVRVEEHLIPLPLRGSSFDVGHPYWRHLSLNNPHQQVCGFDQCRRQVQA